MTDPTTEPDEQLVEAVERAVIDVGADPRSDEDHEAWQAVARAAIAAVRAYDAEHATRLQQGDVQRAIAAAQAAEPYRPAVAAVPPCRREVWTTQPDRRQWCTLPLGHHGGCR